MFGDWQNYLSEGISAEETEKFRSHEKTGRPLGNEKLITDMEKIVRVNLRPRKPGPKGPREKRKS
ncbi:hypothetical protein [Candidatus Contubernalis alkaliaceticus]|uniref:hypothetical protein n=1 Tax=Candidatus Contubernalis alkaliaceticus TaxID=338645 RepID=UPI001F4BE038|nr:hypothetical protein [Candidatus Contubernalis alkalaceticus]UNC93264.1 hypothetical protein HUE98_14910 [Candidatus Contubernalis alkalaceticus]